MRDLRVRIILLCDIDCFLSRHSYEVCGLPPGLPRGRHTEAEREVVVSPDIQGLHQEVQGTDLCGTSLGHEEESQGNAKKKKEKNIQMYVCGCRVTKTKNRHQKCEK